MKIKNYLSALVCIICCMLMLTCMASAETASGDCGTGAGWTLDESGVLTISGSGDMTDFTTAKKVAWYSYADTVTGVVVEEGITSIGKNSFRGCENLSEVSLPESITSIGMYAFRDCVSLEKIVIPDGVTTIDGSAFEGCEALSDVKLGEGLITIGDEAFVDCVSLTEIKIPKSAEELGADIFAGCDEIVVTVYYGSAAMDYCAEYEYSHTAICTVELYSDEKLISGGEYTFGESLILPENTISKEGYDFIGWKTGDTVYNAADSISVEGNLTINAVWEIQTFDIIFETNGGSNPAPVSKKYGESITIPEAEKEGYTFLGWSTINGAETPEYKEGDTFSQNTDTILYGVWEMKTYTIKFDVNGGNGSIADCTKRYWEKLQIPDTVPTLEGNTFMGWGVNSEAVVARYQPGGLMSENGDMTLYAVWREGITAGDSDNNGMVNIADLLFMMKRINNYNVQLTDDNKTAMDVYGDTYFNIKDVLKMAQFLAGWTNVVLGE